MTSASAALARTAPNSESRLRALARWNRFLALAHLVQFVVMVAISTTAARFVAEVTFAVPRIENGQFAGLDQGRSTLIDLPLAWLIASFFLMSAVAHALMGGPLRSRYEAWLARGMNPVRWVEYAFSSTVMILAIASLSLITEFAALLAIAGTNAGMNLFGWSMEAANEGRERVDWKHYIFGCILGLVPWIAIVAGLVAYNLQPDVAPIPGFVYAIIASLFVAFNVFAIIMVLQYRRIGRWADYLTGEKSYMVMSLVAKTLLAWQVWAGTLRG